MRIEATITAPPTIEALGRHARELDELGYDTILVPEAGHDPYLPQMILAEHTRRARIGTGIAISFPRSPFVTAQMAWDLQRFSRGRFVLGLGTQVKGHNERRYSTPWPSPPGPRMREYFQCLRAIFSSFQNPAKPSYFEGQHYRFTLLPPFFNPGPIEHPQVPLYAAAANPFMAQLAGEICEGLRLHPISTFRYTREVILPAVAVGAERGGRNPASFDLIGAPFMALGRDQAQLEAAKNALRKQIAFYASTRSYHGVLAHHGWEDIGLELHRLSVAGEWNRMPALITDDMLDEWAVVTTYDRLADTLRSRCAGLFATVVLVLLGEARQDTDLLRETVRRLHED